MAGRVRLVSDTLSKRNNKLSSMPFPPQVREDALVACGRHCSLCHKFAGFKIECHHIDPEANGGNNCIDNCIPLCFDCHADVQHYNPQHPKGTKFRPSELRAHRDRWFQRVAETTPAIFDEERRAIDRDVFEAFRQILPENLARDLLNERCWGQPMDSEVLDKVYEIDRFIERIDSEFLDPTCEGLRAEFMTSYCKFSRHKDFIQISPMDVGRKYRLPKEWTNSPDAEIRQQFYDCMNNLNKLSSQAFVAYEKMIKEIRRLLIVK